MQAIRNHSSNRLFIATLLISSVLLVVLALNSGAGTYTSVAAAPELQTAPVFASTPWEVQACPPNWNVVNSPNPLSNNYLKAIAVVSANDVWAAGDYSQFDNGTLGGTLFEHWNGSSWTQIPGAGGTVDHEGLLNGVAAVSSNDVWAVGMYYPGTAGQNLIEHWNGTQWTIVPSPNRPGYNELLAATAISANDVWAVGDTRGNHGTLTEHWNGSNWTIVPSPPESFGNDFLLTSVSALSSNDVWAVGYQDRGSGMSSTLIEHWDGTQWSVVPSPNPGSYYGSLYGVTAITSNDVWAVGAYSNDGGSTYPTLMLHWNGTEWIDVPGNSTSTYNSLRGVAAVSSTDIWAVGLTSDCGLCLTFDTLIEHWNGTQWSVVPSQNGNNEFNRLRGVAAASAEDVWTVGYSDQYAYPYMSDTLIEHHTCAPPPTVTGTPPTNTPTRTSTTTPTATNTPCAVPAIQNGGFETGSFSPGWVIQDAVPTPVVRNSQPHSGSYSAFLGSDPGGGEPLGNASIYQQFTVPAGATLSFWYYPFTTDNISFDWQDAYITDVNGNILATIMHVCESNQTWTNVTYSLAAYAGQTVRVKFLVHQDGYGDVTNMYVDDALLLGACGTPGATNTPLPPTSTPVLPTNTPGVSTNTPGVSTNTPVLTNTSVPASTDTPVPPTATSTPTLSATTTGTVVPATETAMSTTTPTVCSIQFSDVPPGSTFYDNIRCLVCRDIINGYPCGGQGEPCNPSNDPYFRPSNPVTRGQLAKIVSNAAGFSEPHTEQTFEDVPVGSTFYDFVERLASRGIIAGYTCGGSGEPCVPPGSLPYFRPNANVTRGQTSKIVAIARGLPSPPSGQQTFQDVLESSTFWPWVEALAGIGAINGYQCGGAGEPCVPSLNRPYFRPGANVTRGQSAKIVATTFFPGCNP